MTRSTFIRPHLCPCRAAALPIAVLLLLAAAGSATAQPSYPPDMEGTTAEVYRTVGDVELNMYLCNPEGHSADDKRPAIVFFFGGGWRSGSPQQFLPHCRYPRRPRDGCRRRRLPGGQPPRGDGERMRRGREERGSLAACERGPARHRPRTHRRRRRIGGWPPGCRHRHSAGARSRSRRTEPDPQRSGPVQSRHHSGAGRRQSHAERGRAREVRKRSPNGWARPPSRCLPTTTSGRACRPRSSFTAPPTPPCPTARPTTSASVCARTRPAAISSATTTRTTASSTSAAVRGDEKNKWYEDTVSRMDGFLYSLEWLDPKPNPDGTPGERLTWEESLSRALGNQRLPAAVSEIKDKLERRAATTAASEDAESNGEESTPPDGKQVDNDDIEHE